MGRGWVAGWVADGPLRGAGEPCGLERTPHELVKLLILELVRRVEAGVHAPSIGKALQKLVARGRPQLISQGVCEPPRVFTLHGANIPVAKFVIVKPMAARDAYKIFLGMAPGVRKTYQMLEEAHTNVPGSENAKRHEDVDQALAAGIDVYSTVNVQHVESLAGQIGRYTGAQVRETLPDRHHLVLRSRFRVQTYSGTWLALSVVGIQDPPVVVELPGAMTISTSPFDRSFSQPSDTGILVDTAGGPSAAAEQSMGHVLAGFPNAQVHTVAAFIKSQQAGIDTLLGLFYVLLALSIVVSLFGIVNTLALAIVERTGEIGTLRAMGMTRRQVSRMIRIESEITALIGAVIGIVVGVVLAALATLALSSWKLSFTLPVSTLVVLLVVALFAGRLAARTPARRAAKLDPLRALQYE
jgi:Osmosensitive K+ channel His kinase sensor domain/FtsX-like permease family